MLTMRPLLTMLTMRPLLTGSLVVRSEIHWLNMPLRWMRCIGAGLVLRTMMTMGSGTIWTAEMPTAVALQSWTDLLHEWAEQRRFGCLMQS